MSSSSSSSSSSSDEEWVDSCDYGDPAYWEGYYQHHATQRGVDTEWYAPLGAFLSMMPTPAQLQALRAVRRDTEQSELRTLVLGCGNSELSEHLRDAGYGHIVSVDISAVCVQQMCEQHADDTRLSFVEGDVRDMKQLFPDRSFDLVVDKATLDAVFIASGTGSTDGENFLAVDEFLRESRRVLVDGGFFICVSHMDRTGFFAPPLILHDGDKGWKVDAARLWRIDKLATGAEQRFGYFAYLCQVGNALPLGGEPAEPEPEPEPAAKAAHEKKLDHTDAKNEAMTVQDTRLAKLEVGKTELKQAATAAPGASQQHDTAGTTSVLEWNAAGDVAAAEAVTSGEPRGSEARGRVWFELEALPPLVP
jgi:SAM-dependent methyltransferase